MHDVIVVGARCAGAATAMLLARSGHDVLVVDKGRLFGDRFGDTVSTHGIARGGVVQLSRWGLLDRVLAGGAPAIEHVSFHIDGQETIRRIKHRAGVDVLVAPRRPALDGLLARAAVESGAELRTGVAATGVLWSADGRVTGIAARTPDGNSLELPARFVVGADGLRSRMAGHFDAHTIEQFTSPCSIFYTYVTGLRPDTFEFHIAQDAFAGVFPTHDGQACVWLFRPTGLLESVRTAGADRPAALVTQLERVAPGLAERVRTSRITEPVRGVSDAPNYIRTAHGPGWALVGDAGYHRDPITGHGITDAFRDAELLASAIDRGLREPAAEADALAAYQATRDGMLRETFDITRALTQFPDPNRFVELQVQLSGALEREADLLAALTPRLEGVVGSAA